MKILITGSNGFIAQNLIKKLIELEHQVVLFDRNSNMQELEYRVAKSSIIFHLAGVNRPHNTDEFYQGNTDLTNKLCEFWRSSGLNHKLVFTSSTQAEIDNDYGRSKVLAEEQIKNTIAMHPSKLACIYRLPNVFGPLSRPNYNTVVATFSYNISHNLDIRVENPEFEMTLVYVEDVIRSFIENISSIERGVIYKQVPNEYKMTLGALASTLREIKIKGNSYNPQTSLDMALFETYNYFKNLK